MSPRTSRLLTRKSIWPGRTVRLELERVVLPGGVTTELEIVHHPGASCVLPLLPGGEVVMLRQFRHAIGGDLLEIPAGKLDPGEDPEHCAARELAEETGYRAARLVPLGRLHTTPGFCDEVIHLFLADGLEPGESQHEETELITMETMRVDDVIAMVADGTITDSKTIATVARARLRGLI